MKENFGEKPVGNIPTVVFVLFCLVECMAAEEANYLKPCRHLTGLPLMESEQFHIKHA